MVDNRGMTIDQVIGGYLDPNITQRGDILPIGRTADGQITFAVPNMLVEGAKSAMLPGHVVAGGDFSPQDVTNLAIDAGTAGYATSTLGGSPRGALGMSGGRVAGDAPIDDATRAANFKKWFGDSKVVDDAGEPLTVYHGTAGDFERFYSDRPAWFSPSADKAEAYASTADGANIVPAHMSIERPFAPDYKDTALVSAEDVIDEVLSKAEGAGIDVTKNKSDILNAIDKFRGNMEKRPQYRDYMYEYWRDDGSGSFKELLDAVGYDGIAIKEGSAMTYGALNPTQVKSVHNRGTYAPNDQNMLRANAPTLSAANLLGATQEKTQAPTQKMTPELREFLARGGI